MCALGLVVVSWQELLHPVTWVKGCLSLFVIRLNCTRVYAKDEPLEAEVWVPGTSHVIRTSGGAGGGAEVIIKGQ